MPPANEMMAPTVLTASNMIFVGISQSCFPFEDQRAVQMGKTKKNKRKKKLNLKKETLLSLEDDLELSKSEKLSLVLHFKLVFLVSLAIFTLLAPA